MIYMKPNKISVFIIVGLHTNHSAQPTAINHLEQLFCENGDKLLSSSCVISSAIKNQAPSALTFS
jgi:hypothetical protein